MSRVCRQSLTPIAFSAALALLPLLAQAEDPPPKTDTPPAPTSAEAKKPPMKMNEPMAGEMKKEGAMKGDVKKAAEKKDKDMKEEMEKEEKAMKK